MKRQIRVVWRQLCNPLYTKSLIVMKYSTPRSGPDVVLSVVVAVGLQLLFHWYALGRPL